MSHFVLGVDGGGTKTQAAILDEGGQVCATGLGGPSNYDDIGLDQARANIAQAVAVARRRGGLDEAPFSAAFLGLAGVVSARDRAAGHTIAADLRLAVPERIGIDHDCRIALAGGLSGRPGIVLIAGTGSSCYGLNAAGENWRSGGWGSRIGDEGSGYWLGLQALISAVRAYDGRGEATRLQADILTTLGLADMNDIMHRLYVDNMARSEIAALGPLVLEAAGTGDGQAKALIGQACADLADCVRAVAGHLGFSGTCEVALVGGLVQGDPHFAQTLRGAIQQRLPQSRCQRAELPPVLGAGILALQLAGIPLSAAHRAALQQTVIE